jgi:tRNA(Ile)-lysidine synthase
LLEPVAALLTQRDLLRPGCTLVLALSGGRDSVALLDVLIRLRERAGFTLLAAHMNHGLRPNARRDEEFVAALCARHGVPLWIRAVTLGHRAKSGEGLEAAARRARYAFLAEVMRQSRAQAVLTAHHASDQAETLLLQLMRGAGLSGLSAMRPARSDGLLRPLLTVSREEIDAYCRTHNLSFVEDETNAGNAYLRNRVRHELLPVMERLRPGSARAVARAAGLLAEDADYLDQIAEQSFDQNVRPFYGAFALAPGFARLPGPIASRALRLGCARLGCMAEQASISRAMDLIRSGRPGGVSLGGGVRLRVTGYSRVLEPEQLPPTPQPIPFTGAGRYCLGAVCIVVSGGVRRPGGVCVDAERVGLGAVLRYPEPGDWITLTGVGRKKLSDYFTDRKVDRRERAHTPVLARGRHVLWMIPMAVDDAVVARPGARVFLWIDT